MGNLGFSTALTDSQEDRVIDGGLLEEVPTHDRVEGEGVALTAEEVSKCSPDGVKRNPGK